MKIESKFDIGQTVEYTADNDSRIQGVIYAITVAEPAPGGYAFWYSLILDDETEVEVEEPGSDITLVGETS